MRRTVVALLLLVTAAACVGQDDSILVLKKSATASGPAYEGGKVQFLDVWLEDQLVHYAEPGEIPLRLSIKYNVLETAPVLLNSRFGTEYWLLHNFETDQTSALYTWEDMDISKPGEAVVTVDRAVPNERYGPLPFKGLVGVRGHYYFLIDRPNREYIGAIRPPAFFDRPSVVAKLHCTLANLTDFSLQFAECQSTWQPGGTFRARLTVTDADGDNFPVIQMPATAEAGDWQTELTVQLDYLHQPTGWIVCKLPDGAAPERVAVKAMVSIMAPDGPTVREVAASFDRGTGQASEEEMSSGPPVVELPRNAEGVVRETRAAWMWGSTILTPEDTDAVVARAKQAGINVLVVCLTGGDRFLPKSDLWPQRDDLPEGYDPLADLIEKSHETGMEVHPWFSVMYRRQAFRDGFGSNIDMIDENGKLRKLGADVHRPEYRDFVVDLMVGVARDYEVDGIHLDYIRTMGRCYCDTCRAEFEEQFGKPLAEATDEDWGAWQKEAIADVVRRTAEGVREVRPNAIMSAAVFSNMSGGAGQGQDAQAWARQGWIDMVMPMDYKVQTLELRSSERTWLEAMDDADRLVTGLSLYMRSGSEALSRPAELVAEQVQLIRSMGIHGYSLFRFGIMSDEQLEMLETEVNQEPAVPYFR